AVTYRPPTPRYGPPPGSPRDTGPLPPGGRTDNGGWVPQAARPTAPLQRPPAPPSQGPQQSGQPRSSPGYAPGHRAAPPPPAPAPSSSYAERIRADELVPPRHVPPARGWRLALYRATFGLVNMGQGPDEVRQSELETKIKSTLRGHFKVGVMGKG